MRQRAVSTYMGVGRIFSRVEAIVDFSRGNQNIFQVA